MLLIPREKYLSAGVHIGMKFKTADMKRFIYKIRPNGLAVINLSMLDERIRYVAQMLAKEKNILVVSRKEHVRKAVKAFADAIGADAIVGRFMPGLLTNPSLENFKEPDVLFAIDPAHDKQAITESVKIRIPIISLADTSNETSFVDIVIPANNKSKKSVALVLWLLAKEIMKNRGEKFKATLEDFGYEEK